MLYANFNGAKQTLTRHAGIFLGAVWAYILLFMYIGAEMSQEERNEEAALSEQYEQMRAQGVSLAEIGVGRAKGVGLGEEPGMNETVEEKAALRHVERA